MAHVDMSTLLPNIESQCAWGVCKLKALQAVVKITALLWFGLFSFASVTACAVCCRSRVTQALPWLFLAELWLLFQENLRAHEKVNMR